MLRAIHPQVEKSWSQPYIQRLKRYLYRSTGHTYGGSIHPGMVGGVRRLDEEVRRGSKYILTFCLRSQHASLACHIPRSVLYAPYSHFGKKTLQKSAL